MPCPITVSSGFPKSFPVHSALFLSTFIETKKERSETLMKDRLLTLYKSMGQLCFKAHIKAGVHIRYTYTLILKFEHLSTNKLSIKRYNEWHSAMAAPFRTS